MLHKEDLDYQPNEIKSQFEKYKYHPYFTLVKNIRGIGYNLKPHLNQRLQEYGKFHSVFRTLL